MTATVLLPAHGEAIYLEEALSSVLNDVPRNCQVIVIDDNLSREVRTKIKNVFTMFPNLSIISNRGEGLIDALNTGLFETKSEIVFRMDSDDIWLPGRYQLQYSALTLNENLILCGGQVEFISSLSAGKKISNYPTINSKVRKFLRHGSPFAHPAVAFKRNYVTNHGSYRKTFMNGKKSLVEDYDLWLRLSRIPGKELCNLSEVILQYRVHNLQTSKVYRSEQELATFLTKLSFKDNQSLKDVFGDLPIQIRDVEYRWNCLLSILKIRSLSDALFHQWNMLKITKGKWKGLYTLFKQSRSAKEICAIHVFIFKLIISKLQSTI